MFRQWRPRRPRLLHACESVDATTAPFVAIQPNQAKPSLPVKFTNQIIQKDVIKIVFQTAWAMGMGGMGGFYPKILSNMLLLGCCHKGISAVQWSKSTLVTGNLFDEPLPSIAIIIIIIIVLHITQVIYHHHHCNHHCPVWLSALCHWYPFL